MPDLHNSLASVLQQLEFVDELLTAESIQRLDEYARLLWHWNQQLNLTRHMDYQTFAVRDVLDTVELARLIPLSAEVLDIGSGGGVPGLTLAIIRPDLQISLCESTRKKANVLNRMRKDLGLEVPVYDERSEQVLKDFSFDLCTARAVGSIGKLQA